MGEDLFDLAGQPAPVRDDRSGAMDRVARAFRSPERAQATRASRREGRGAGGGGRERRRRNGGQRKPRLAGAVSPAAQRGADRSRGSRCEMRRSPWSADTSRNPDCEAGRELRQYPSEPGRNRPLGCSAPERARAAASSPRARAIGSSRARSRARMRAILPSTGAVWRPKAIAAIAAAV